MQKGVSEILLGMLTRDSFSKDFFASHIAFLIEKHRHTQVLPCLGSSTHNGIYYYVFVILWSNHLQFPQLLRLRDPFLAMYS